MKRYYLAIDGAQRGPYEVAELPARGLRADTLVWTEGMMDWQRADAVPELRHLFAEDTWPGPPNAPPPPPAVPGHVPHYRTDQPVHTNRIAAGVLGILLGSLGVHKFVLGYTGAGLVMLLATVLTCGIAGMVMSVIGLIEGIIYLTKTDEEFHREYVLNAKPWF